MHDTFNPEALPIGCQVVIRPHRIGAGKDQSTALFRILQEILTIKSDDVVGRSKAYEAIVKGDPMPTPGIPESLNVLLHELRGLGLSIKLD